MSGGSITKKGEVLKMLLKVSDLSETKSKIIFKKGFSGIFDVEDKIEELNVTK